MSKSLSYVLAFFCILSWNAITSSGQNSNTTSPLPWVQAFLCRYFNLPAFALKSSSFGHRWVVCTCSNFAGAIHSAELWFDPCKWNIIAFSVTGRIAIKFIPFFRRLFFLLRQLLVRIVSWFIHEIILY